MDADRVLQGGVGQATPHESAELHVSGEAIYVDDIPEPRNLLHLALGVSTKANARITSVDLSPCLESEGVIAVAMAEDVPGANHYGAILEDEDPIFAVDRVEYVGQSLFAVAAETVSLARRAALRAKVSYETLPAILDIPTALSSESHVLPSVNVSSGTADKAIDAAPRKLRSSLRVGGQDHFYLEGQVALVVPKEGGDIYVYSSTQHPGEIQQKVADTLGLKAKNVVVECRRMGGAFGGKETQPALIVGAAAVMAKKTGRPCKLRLDRDVDMAVTGKRHDFLFDYDVGFTEDGVIAGISFEFASRCGMSADLSGPINDRAVSHCDNAYFLENVNITSHRCKTNTVSNTAFRGFGGPQGMYAIEYVMDDIARSLRLDSLDVRRRNLYQENQRNVTPYGQLVEDNILDELFDKLESSSDYRARKREIETFNLKNPHLKRGIALTPVKFGISFTTTFLNQAGALIHIYRDGTVHLNHGGTEMGQGLFTKVAQVVAEVLQIDISNIKVTASDTSKVPNASATAASSGADLNGKAAEDAALKLRQRLAEFAEQKYGVAPHEVRFEKGSVYVGTEVVRFCDLVEQAWLNRISMSATGFYKTPKIGFDDKKFEGRPYYYFAYGAAVSEVIVDVLTGEHRLQRVDILHDCGKSLNPALDIGQIEGGFVQGTGWLTSEELCWNDDGVLMTHAPSTYKIPTCADIAQDFRVNLFESKGNVEDTIFRSKAVGEPPLMLALSVFFAIRDAIASEQNPLPNLQAPATPEAVLRAFCAGRDEGCDK